MECDRPSTFRTFSDPDSLHLSATHASSMSNEKLVFPNPAISIITAISHQAIKTCKHIGKIPSRSSSRSSRSSRDDRLEKAPDMKKMRVVTPVYDHVLERWVWPDSVFADDLAYERRHYEGRRSTDSSRSREGRGRSSTMNSTLSLGSTTSRGSTSSRGSASSRTSRY